MIIGLTGGIASGKTLVSDHLKTLGYPVVDADVLSREIMAQGSPVLAEVRAVFGQGVFTDDGSLDRAALAALIFHDDAARKKLDAITHPAITQLAQKRFQEFSQDALVFFVVPLLYESGMDALCDDVWLVHAPEDARKKRLMARDGIDQAYAEAKIASQMSDAERLLHHPRVIENDGDVQALYARVQDLLEKTCKKCEKKC